MRNVFANFSMPGARGIPNFGEHAFTISIAGIFDLESIARSQQLIVEKTGVIAHSPKTEAGKPAVQDIVNMTGSPGIEGQRRIMENLRDLRMQEAEDAGLLAPFILGRTINFRTVEVKAGGITIPRIVGLERVA